MTKITKAHHRSNLKKAVAVEETEYVVRSLVPLPSPVPLTNPCPGGFRNEYYETFKPEIIPNL